MSYYTHNDRLIPEHMWMPTNTLYPMELELTEPPDKFIGEAVVLDVSTIRNGHGITSSNLEKYISIVKSGDIVFTLYWYVPNCIRTVWKIAIKMNMKRQGVIFIYLEPSAADWIVNHDIKCVGIDTLSIEREDFTEGIIHKKLLSHDIGIIENLNSNLRRFVDKRIFYLLTIII
jgi:arylformamidase